MLLFLRLSSNFKILILKLQTIGSGWEKKPNVSAGTTPASVSLVHIPGASPLAKGEKAKAKRSERKKKSRHAKQQRNFNESHQPSLASQVPVCRSKRN